MKNYKCNRFSKFRMIQGLVLLLLCATFLNTFAQEPYQRMIRKFEVPEIGIENPTGIAFSPASGAFIITQKTATSEVLILPDASREFYSVTIAAVISNPVNMAFDRKSNNFLFFDTDVEELVEIEAGSEGLPEASPQAVKRYNVKPFNAKQLQGMTFDPETGDVFFLVAPGPPDSSRIVRVSPDPQNRFDGPAARRDGRIYNIVLKSLASVPLKGIAFNPDDGNLYIMSPTEDKLYELTDQGDLKSVRDMSFLELSDVQNMVFAPSGDQTDDPDIESLYIADNGLSSQSGYGDITELSLTQPYTLELASITQPASLVATVLTSQWNPPSPDPTGGAYIPSSNNLLISDSEVNEISSLFTGVNVFESTLSGNIVSTFGTLSFSNEPTGVAFNPNNQHLYFTDDNRKQVFELDPGNDNLYDTSDDIITSFDTDVYGSNDPEGITFDIYQGHLFVADGVNAEVYEISPGSNGVFDGMPPTSDDELVNQFDTAILGLNDPEGVDFNPDNGNLYIVSNATGEAIVVETTIDGMELGVIDFSSLNVKNPGGLVYAPTSVNELEKSLYLIARGVDNNSDPNENDGVIYEISLGSLTPSISINDISVLEGDAGTVNATFMVSLSGIIQDIVTVDYSTQDGTATGGSDYISTYGTLTFSAGETSKQVIVEVNGDEIEEGDETFFVQLSNASGNTMIANGQGTGTITDDDGTLPITVSFQDGVNGYSGTRDTKLRSGAPDTNYGDDTTLDVDGSPDESSMLFWDVTSIPIGSTIQSVDITFNVKNTSGSATYEIYDLKRPWVEDEATWNVFAAGQNWEVAGADGSADRGPNELGAFVGSSSGPAVASLNVEGITVIQSWVDNPSSNHGIIVQDYINHTNGLGFSSREESTIAERPKLTITYVAGNTPSLSIDDVTVTEGNTGFTDAMFAVRLSEQSNKTVTVDYITTDGTAVAGDDYIASGLQTLTFLPGETSQMLAVSVNGDILSETDEYFFIDLSNPMNANLIDLQGQATIIDDDGIDVIRGPYLQLSTPTSIIVRWRTTQSTNSVVRYGTDPGNLNLSNSDPGLSTEHEIYLTGLSSDSKYYYSVGTTTETLAGGDSSHFFVTSPASNQSKKSRIWILGDSGTKDDNARSVRDAYYNFSGNNHTDLWLMLGDNAYEDGTDAEYQIAVFENMYEQMLGKSVLWPTLGNHDNNVPSNPGPYPYYDIFTLPENGESGGFASNTEAYYSFDYSNIHIICLNSSESNLRSSGSPMWTWLQSDLAANDKDWTIAFWHHPPYSKGQDSDIQVEEIEMRERALPILENGGVDLVLGGHAHTYERSFLIDGHYGLSNTLTNEMILDSGDGKIDGTGAYKKPSIGPTAHEGTVYIVAGSSGEAGGPYYHPVMVSSLQELGSLVLDIDAERLDATYLEATGTVGDYFTILKGSPVPNFSGSPLSGNAPLSVTFVDSSIGTVTDYSWDFGDGESSTEQYPTHTYNAAGIYTVSLTVSGPGGTNTETKTDYINVQETNLTITIDDVIVTEGDNGTVDATFNVNLSSASSQMVTVDYVTMDSTAIAPDDYAALTLNTLSFNPGDTTQILTVTVNSDTLDEVDEIFLIQLNNATNATISDNEGQGTIMDDDPPPALSINDVSTDEGAGMVRFTVSLSTISSKDVSVNFSTNDNSAVAPDDYTATSGTLNIPAGSGSDTITVSIIDDAESETAETFTIDLSAAVNATLEDNQGVGTITDNEGVPSLAINDVAVTEGNSGAVSAIFRVTLSSASAQTVTVDYTSSDGTATSPSDYTSVIPSTLTFTPGDTTQNITITVNGDLLDEADETFFIDFSNPVNVALPDNQGQGTIMDDDPAPSLSINDVGVDEGAGTLSFIVSLSTVSGQAVNINYATTDGTATAPGDYTAVSGILNIPAGSGSDTITVNINDDSVSEGVETFTMDLSAAVNATLADNQGVGTITDNEGVPSLAIDDVTVTEGNSGSVNAIFNLTLSPMSAQNVTVDYYTSDGTATAPDDYIALSQTTLNFTAGDTTQSITVTVNGDSIDETNETFFVNLSNPVNAALPDNQGLGTITDEDPAPTISINDVSTSEGAGAFTFIVSLSTISGQDVSVQYATADASAVAPDDYTAVSDTLNFPAGVDSASIIVNINDDGISEINETFSVNLSNAVNATISDNQGVGTITDNDGGQPITVSFQDGANGYTGARDTRLRGNRPTSNYGNHVRLQLDGNPDDSSLLFWDLTGIPIGSIIQSVEISVYVTNKSGNDYEFYQMQRDWIESEATWNEYATGQSWEIPGADGTADRGSTVLGSITSPATGPVTISLNADGVAMVQLWVDNPSANRGFIILDYVNATNGLDFSSREVSLISDRPKLTVTYLSSAQANNQAISMSNSNLIQSSEISTQLIPEEFGLDFNYPNPFNLETHIKYALPEAVNVRLIIYNIRGEKVRQLVDQVQPPGYKTVLWNGRNDNNKVVSSGIYFIQLVAGQKQFMGKMILQK